jgi:hypothetical protein
VASGGQRAASGITDCPGIPAGVTVSYVSYWDSPSGGVFQFSEALGVSVFFIYAGTLRFTSQIFTVSTATGGSLTQTSATSDTTSTADTNATTRIVVVTDTASQSDLGLGWFGEIDGATTADSVVLSFVSVNADTSTTTDTATGNSGAISDVTDTATASDSNTITQGFLTANTDTGGTSDSNTASNNAPSGLSIANPGFESAIGSVEGTTNWWPSVTYTGVAERLSNAEITGSYVGRLYAPLDGESALTAAYLAAKATKATVDAGPTWTFKVRPKGTVVGGTATLACYAKDSGGNVILSATADKHLLVLWRTGSSGPGFGASADTTTIAFSPSVNTTVTKSFNVKTWIEARLDSGKTWADVDSVILQFSGVAWDTYGHASDCEFYVDN